MTSALILGLVFACQSGFIKPLAPVGKPVFVAVGYGGLRMISEDGKKWSDIQETAKDGGDDDNLLFNVVFFKGEAFAVGGGAGRGRVMTTSDGRSWTEVYKTNSRVCPLVLGDKGFVAGCGDKMILSKDGKTWADGGRVASKDGVHFRRAAFGNGVYVFSGDADEYAISKRTDFRYSTVDGQTMIAKQIDMVPTRGLAFGAGQFVLVGMDGFRQVSTDGKAWTQADQPGEDFQWIRFMNGRFFLGGKSLWISDDGVKWTKREDLPAYPEACVFGAGKYLATSWKGNAHWAEEASPGAKAFAKWTKAPWGESNAIVDIAFGTLKGR